MYEDNLRTETNVRRAALENSKSEPQERSRQKIFFYKSLSKDF